MDRQDAFRLADEMLIATNPDATHKLRPMLVETFATIEPPEAQLIVRSSRQLKAYLLHARGLLIADAKAEPPTVETQWVNLDDATVTRQCHDAKGSMSGIWWATTWCVLREPVDERFVGQEGPQSIDDSERFGRMVAHAAGWPIAPPAKS